MIDRRKIVIYGLLIIGFVMAFGGWAINRAGDTYNMFPLWVSALGFFVLFGGVYLWYMNKHA